MKWEHVIKSIDPATVVREVHVTMGDKELVMIETPDGRRETYTIDAKGSKIVYMPQDGVFRTPFEPLGSGVDFTKVAPFDCTHEYIGDGTPNAEVSFNGDSDYLSRPKDFI